MTSQSQDLGEKVIIRRGRVDSVDLYEVKENELELLEKGSPASLQLNFSIFLLSIALSAVFTLSTATVKAPIWDTVYIVIAVVGFLLGLYLLLIWWRTYSSIRKIIAVIRARIPPEVVKPEQVPAIPNNVPPSDHAPAG